MKERFIDFMKKELEPKTVLIACGIPALYKTETTEVIADLLGYKILKKLRWNDWQRWGALCSTTSS